MINVSVQKSILHKPYLVQLQDEALVSNLIEEYLDGLEQYAYVVVNGQTIDPGQYGNTVVEDGDHVSIALRPEADPGTWAAVGTWIVENWIATTALVAAAYAGYTLSTLETPSDESGQEKRARIEGLRNTPRKYEPVPILLGKHRVTPDWAAQPYVETVGNTQYYNLLLSGGYAPQKLEDFRIGDTPIDQYEDVQVWYTGEYGGSAVESDTVERFSSSYGTSLNQQWPYDVAQEVVNVEVQIGEDLFNPPGYVTRTTGTETDEIKIDLSFPTGLIKISDDGKGNEFRARRHLQTLITEQTSGDQYYIAKVKEFSSNSSSRYGAYTGDVYRDTSTGNYYWVDYGYLNGGDVKDQSGSGYRRPRGTEIAGLTSGPQGSFRVVQIPSSQIQFYDRRSRVVGVNTAWSDNLNTFYGVMWTITDKTRADFFESIKFSPGVEDQFDVSIRDGVGVYSSGNTEFIDNYVGVCRWDFLTTYRYINNNDFTKLIGADKAPKTVSDNPSDPLVNTFRPVTIIVRIKATNQLSGMLDKFNYLGTSVVPSNWAADWRDWDSLSLEPTESPAKLYRWLLQGPMNANPLSNNKIDLNGLEDWRDFCDSPFGTVEVGAITDVDNSGGYGFRKIQISNISGLTNGSSYDVTIQRPSGTSNSVNAFYENGYFNIGVIYAEEGWQASVKTSETNNFSFSTSGFLRERSTLLKELNKVAWTGRGEFSFVDGKYGVSVKQEKGVPVQMFTPKNSWGFSSSRQFPEDTDGIKFEFPNEDQNFEEDEGVFLNPDKDPSVGGDATLQNGLYDSVELPYTTNSEVALTQARFGYFENRLQREVYTLETDIEGLKATRGDLVLLQNDVIEVGLGVGRVMQASGSTFYLEETINLTAGDTYGISIRSTDLVSTGSARYEGNKEWTILSGNNPIEGDLVVYGEAGIETLPCIVQSTDYGTDLSVKLTLVNYSDFLYQRDQTEIPEYNSNISIPRISYKRPAAPTITVPTNPADLANGTARVRFKASPREDSPVRMFSLEARSALAPENDPDDPTEIPSEWSVIGVVEASEAYVDLDLGLDNYWELRGRALAENGLYSPYSNVEVLNVPSGPAQDVDSLNLVEFVNTPKSADANLSTIAVTVGKPADGNFAYAEIQYRKVGQYTYVNAGRIGSLYDNRVDIVVASDGSDYEVVATSVSITGVRSTSDVRDTVTVYDVENDPTKPEIIIPNVKGLEVFDQGNDNEFVGRDVEFNWRDTSFNEWTPIGHEPKQGVDYGGLDLYFRDYEIKVFDMGDNLLSTYYREDSSFTYTYELNRQDYKRVNGSEGGNRQFRIEVRIRGRNNQFSEKAARLTVSNPAPQLPALFPSVGFTHVSFNYTAPDDRDFTGIALWLDDEEGFTRTDDNLVHPLGADTSISIDDLDTGTTYYVKYQAFDAFGEGPISDEFSFTTNKVNSADLDDTPPSVPDNLTLTSGIEESSLATKSWVKAEWDVSTDDGIVTGYFVSYYTDVNPDPVEIFTGSNEYRITDATPGRTYYVKVKAQDWAGNTSDYSDEISISADGDTDAPAVPTGISATGGLDKVVVKWINPSDDDFLATRLHRGTTSGFTPTSGNLITTQPGRKGEVVQAIDSEVQNENEYFYKVVAVDVTGNISSTNSAVSATPEKIKSANVQDFMENSAIGSVQLADAAVNTAKLADLSVEAAKLVDGAVTTTKIADLAVGNAAIANAAITNAKIGTAAITEAKIEDAAITTAKIDNLAVTDAKINNIDAVKITAGTIDADRIGADTITASKIDVTNLSAISADLGTITAGTVTGATVRTAASGARVELTSTSGVTGRNSTDSITFQLDTDGSGFLGITNAISWNTDGEVTVPGTLIGGEIVGNTFKTAESGWRAEMSSAYPFRYWDGTTTLFSLDSSGDATFAGELSAATGSFSGSVTIGSGSSGVSNLSDAGTLATKNNADWSVDVVGSGKPEDNADVTSKHSNSIDNPSFEAGDKGWSLGSGRSIVNDPSNARDGDWCLQFTGLAGAFAENETRLQVEPGDRVLAQAFFKATGGTGSFSVVVRWRDSSGGQLGYSFGNSVSSSSYEQSRYVGTAPAGAATVSLLLDTGGSSVDLDGYADGAYLSIIPKDTDIDALQTTNGPAESGAETTTGKSLTVLVDRTADNIDESGTRKWAAESGATVGANWSTTLSNIPNRIKDNATTGLNLTETYMGYYDGTDFQTYIQNNGNFHFGGTGNNYIDWNGSDLVLAVDRLGSGASNAGLNSIALGSGSSAYGNDSVSVGRSSSSGESGISLGYGSAAGNIGLAIGRNSIANGTTIAIGDTSEVDSSSSYAIAVGINSSVTNTSGSSVVIGHGAFALGALNSVAIGRDTEVSGSGAVAIGRGSAATGTESVSIGYNYNCIHNYSATLLSTSTSDYQIRLGGLSHTVDVPGDIDCEGAITQSSDERKKTNWQDLSEDFLDNLANVKYGTFDRVDKDITQAGVSAQDWQKVLPESVSEDVEGYLTMDYGSSALVTCLELAKEVRQLREEINKMKGEK